MITIRKTDGGEIFDLPRDYVIEAEKNNPMFSDKGSQTVPVNFPTTDKNNRLLNFPQRIDRSDRQEENVGVIVETGSVQQKGLLSVNSASKKVISANIGYDESEMYAVMKDMQLGDMPILNDPEFIKSFGGNNLSEKTNSMLAHLTAVMKEQISAEYCIFPIVLNTEYFEILNNINSGNLTVNTNVSKGELLALEKRVIVRSEGGESINITVLKGYGVSPFLKVYRILEIIFKNFGFTLVENPFKEHRQLKKAVVLNNTVDAIVTGTLYYRDLMPDCSISDFLDALYAKFGMLWFIDSNSRTVRIRFLKDIVNPAGDLESIDLNRMKTEEPLISFSPPKQLRLKMNREFENSKVLYDTMEEFLERYKYQFNGGNAATQRFDEKYSRYKIINVFKLFSNNPKEAYFYSSDFFDWDKKMANTAYEDIEMKDLCIPISNYDLLTIPEYSVNFKHKYSDFVIGGEIREEKNNPAKLAFIFSWGLFQDGTPMNPFYYSFASQFNRDNKGNFINDKTGVKYDISLTCNREDGLYNRFWKEYDAFIRHSNQQVTCNLHLTDRDFIDFRPDEKIFINNQPLVAEQIKHSFDDTGDQISESKFRTLCLMKPFDLTSEQKIPEFGPQLYYWAYTETETNPVPPYPPNFLYPKPTEFIFDRKYYTVNGTEYPIAYVSCLPPTDDQFKANETRIYQYTKKYNMVVLSVFATEVDMSITSIVTVTFYPAKV